jgi:hypothetical protein
LSGLRASEAAPLLRAALAAFVGGLMVKLFCFDLMAWHVGPAMLYGGGQYSFLEGAMRLLDFGVIIAFLGCGYDLLAGSASARRMPSPPSGPVPRKSSGLCQPSSAARKAQRSSASASRSSQRELDWDNRMHSGMVPEVMWTWYPLWRHGLQCLLRHAYRSSGAAQTRSGHPETRPRPTRT